MTKRKACSNKRCTIGKQPLSEFNKSKMHRDGLASWCKTCVNATRNKANHCDRSMEVVYAKILRKQLEKEEEAPISAPMSDNWPGRTSPVFSRSSAMSGVRLRK
jgi:hypothetical protein